MIINGLIVSGAVLLAALGIWGVWLLLRRDDRGDPFASYGLTVSAAGAEDFTDLMPMPPEIVHETSLAPFPPAEWPGTAAAAVPAPGLPPLPEPVPQVDHDEFGPDQFFHDGPPDPAAAGDALPQAAPIPPPPAHHAAVAVGAMIAATHAHLAEAERARAAELEAEAHATRPWADDTGTFTAICAEVT